MPTLAKLLDCLKWPKAAATGQPIRPRGEIVPVADADLSFGWQGYLFNENKQTGLLAANTIGATVTVPDDCFYIVDAVGLAYDAQAAAAFSNTTRIGLEIVDPQGVVAWRLTFSWGYTQITAVGIGSTGPAGEFSMRLHLLAGMVVRWKMIDAFVNSSAAVFSSSVALRKLYEETL